MHEPASPTDRKKKPSRRRRIFIGIAVVLLVLVVFYQPLLHAGLRFAAIQIAARQKLRLDLKLGGNLLTNLTIHQVTVSPKGEGPVEHIRIDFMRFDYSVPKLIKGGVGEFLRSYEIHNADLAFIAKESRDEAERRQKRSIAEQLNQILAQPALYADRVLIQNLTIALRSGADVTRINQLYLFLHPSDPGWLRIARVEVPKLPAWENLEAATSYANRNLAIRDLTLSPELVFEQINFDASQRAQDKGSMLLKGRLFGGRAELSLAGSQLKKKGENLAQSYQTTLELKAQEISLEAAASYFGVQKPPVARLGELAVTFRGEPEKPRTWQGQIGARLETLGFNKVQVDSVDVQFSARDGTGQITAANLGLGRNNVRLTATIGLPESVNDFAKSDIDAQLAIDAPELAAITGMFGEPIAGAVSGDATASLHQNRLHLTAQINAQQLAGRGLSAESAKVDLDMTKRVDELEGPLWKGAENRVTAEIKAAALKSFQLDVLRLDAGSRDEAVTLNGFEVRRAENMVTARGSVRLPEDPAKIMDAPADVHLEINVPRLGEFGVKVGTEVLGGRVTGRGDFQLGPARGGTLRIESDGLSVGAFQARRFETALRLTENDAVLEQLALELDAENRIVLSGKAGLAKPIRYEAGLTVELPNVAALQPLLAAFSQPARIGGAIHLAWKGSGDVQPAAHAGQLELTAGSMRYDNVELSSARLAGNYGPGWAESTEFRVALGETALAGTLAYGEGYFRTSDLVLQQGAQRVLTGHVILPFNPEKPEAMVPLDGVIKASVSADNLDLQKLLASFGQKSPMTGVFSSNLLASGTLLEPVAHLTVAARNFKSAQFAKMDAAAIDLTMHYEQRALSLDTTVRQREIQPLSLHAEVPIDVQEIIRNKKFDPNQPIALSLKLPASSLAALPKFVPAVRRIEGTAAADVRVAGTLGKPQLSGSLNVNVKSARLANEEVPGIDGLTARLNFAQDTLTLAPIEGRLGGGRFSLKGTVKFPELDQLSFGEAPRVPAAIEPVFDLNLTSKEVLVRRDESITIRADTDLRINGPLKAGTVSGSVFITQSRFLREIDILPISLPGKPKPAPKSVPTNKAISFPEPPLRDWKFDIAIQTRRNDPFLIRGNLANGSVEINLRLGGTGLEPWLEGSLRIDQFAATLPFSKLAISRGSIYFTRDAPFVPSLDLQAESRVRDYLINAYIYGTAYNPQVQLSSEPPLPHGDIISLLATGTTVSELGGNAQVLASRAAMLAVQQLYRKTFRRNRPPPKNKDPDNFLDRFQFELGAIDNRTGQQEVETRFKLTDQLYIIGDADAGGEVAGRLQYLIRFR